MDQQTLKSLLRYEPDTGEFYWLVPMKTRYGIVPPGTRAGSTAQNGYRMIGVNKERLLAHRLAWLYVHGRWPAEFLDHKDGDRSNNRIDNLREASRSQNGWNSRKTWGASGIRGVRFNKGEGRWCAQICVNGKPNFLGYFDDAESAAEAYRDAARSKLGSFSPF